MAFVEDNLFKKREVIIALDKECSKSIKFANDLMIAFHGIGIKCVLSTEFTKDILMECLNRLLVIWLVNERCLLHNNPNFDTFNLHSIAKIQTLVIPIALSIKNLNPVLNDYFYFQISDQFSDKNFKNLINSIPLNIKNLFQSSLNNCNSEYYHTMSIEKNSNKTQIVIIYDRKCFKSLEFAIELKQWFIGHGINCLVSETNNQHAIKKDLDEFAICIGIIKANISQEITDLKSSINIDFRIPIIFITISKSSSLEKEYPYHYIIDFSDNNIEINCNRLLEFIRSKIDLNFNSCKNIFKDGNILPVQDQFSKNIFTKFNQKNTHSINNRSVIINDNSNSNNNLNEIQIMISYNHKSSGQLALKIYAALKNYGFQVWYDLYKMYGDIEARMQEAIDNSKIVLCLITDEYFKSDYCIKEYRYAERKKKHIIPIKVNQNYNPTGIIDFIMPNIMYVDFSDSDFNQSFDKLIDQINIYWESLST